MIRVWKGNLRIYFVGSKNIFELNFLIEPKVASLHATFVKKIYDTGVKAVIVVTGLVAATEENNQIFDDKIFELFNLIDSIPLGFYECPEPYKRILTAEQLGKFVATGKIIYHKDTIMLILSLQNIIFTKEA